MNDTQYKTQKVALFESDSCGYTCAFAINPDQGDNYTLPDFTRISKWETITFTMIDAREEKIAKIDEKIKETRAEYGHKLDHLQQKRAELLSLPHLEREDED